MTGRSGFEETRGPRRLDASLDAVTRQLGGEGSKGLGRLFARWPEIAGAALAAHVEPVRIDRQALVVRVDHPAWATQVRSFGDALLDRVVEETGVPRPERLEVQIRL